MTKKMKLIKYDGTNFFKSWADVEDYLKFAFESGDPKLISCALGNAVKARGVLKIAQETKLNRGGLYRTVVAGGDPKLSTFSKIIDVLGFKLSITPKGAI